MASKWLKPPTIVSTTSPSFFSLTRWISLSLFLFTPLLLPSSNHRLDASSQPVSMPSSLRVLAKETHAIWKAPWWCTKSAKMRKGEGRVGQTSHCWVFSTQLPKTFQFRYNIINYQVSLVIAYNAKDPFTSGMFYPPLVSSLSTTFHLFLPPSHSSSHLLNTRPVLLSATHVNEIVSRSKDMERNF